MSLKQRLTDDMKTAMKSGEKNRLGVIRLINASIKQREIDERIVLDDAQVIATLEKMLKQRKDSLSQYEAAGREDLAAVERYEMTVLQAYFPAPLSASEIDAIIDASIAELSASGPKDMGKVIALVRPQVTGRADMGSLSELVKHKLANLG